MTNPGDDTNHSLEYSSIRGWDGDIVETLRCVDCNIHVSRDEAEKLEQFDCTEYSSIRGAVA